MTIQAFTESARCSVRTIKTQRHAWRVRITFKQPLMRIVTIYLFSPNSVRRLWKAEEAGAGACPPGMGRESSAPSTPWLNLTASRSLPTDSAETRDHWHAHAHRVVFWYVFILMYIILIQVPCLRLLTVVVNPTPSGKKKSIFLQGKWGKKKSKFIYDIALFI